MGAELQFYRMNRVKGVDGGDGYTAVRMGMYFTHLEKGKMVSFVTCTLTQCLKAFKIKRP